MRTKPITVRDLELTQWVFRQFNDRERAVYVSAKAKKSLREMEILVVHLPWLTETEKCSLTRVLTDLIHI